jgi:hypothetical protein
MKFKIITDSLKIEEALKQMLEHNTDEFLKAGFLVEYNVIKNGFELEFKFVNKAAKASMTNIVGRNMLLWSMRSKFKVIRT